MPSPINKLINILSSKINEHKYDEFNELFNAVLIMIDEAHSFMKAKTRKKFDNDISYYIEGIVMNYVCKNDSLDIFNMLLSKITENINGVDYDRIYSTISEVGKIHFAICLINRTLKNKRFIISTDEIVEGNSYAFLYYCDYNELMFSKIIKYNINIGSGFHNNLNCSITPLSFLMDKIII